MPPSPKLHRQTFRLQKFDYSTLGAYFITICTQDKGNIFGDIHNGIMGLNEVGCMVAEWWQKLPDKYPQVKLDQFTVMPNHMHGVVWIRGPKSFESSVGAIPCGCPEHGWDSNHSQKNVGAIPCGCPKHVWSPKHGQAQGAAPTGGRPEHGWDSKHSQKNVGAIPCGCPKHGAAIRHGQAQGAAPTDGRPEHGWDSKHSQKNVGAIPCGCPEHGKAIPCGCPKHGGGSKHRQVQGAIPCGCPKYGWDSKHGQAQGAAPTDGRPEHGWDSKHSQKNVGAIPCGRPKHGGDSNHGQAQGTAPTDNPKLGNLIGAFKSITTHEYIKNVKTKHWPRFNNRLWQRNYYEHIIRNDTELQNIRQYIINNPAKWQYDQYNKQNTKLQGLKKQLINLIKQLKTDIIYVFGNQDYQPDSLAISLAYQLQSYLPSVKFQFVKPNQDVPFINQPKVYILDAVAKISRPTLFSVGAVQDSHSKSSQAIHESPLQTEQGPEASSLTVRKNAGSNTVKPIFTKANIKLPISTTVHDFDLGFQIKYLLKLGKLKQVYIIGIPI